MRTWWQGNPDKAQVAKSILTDLQTLAADADRDAATVNDDPFADLPPASDDGLTSEQRAELEAAEAAIRAEMAERDARATAA